MIPNPVQSLVRGERVVLSKVDAFADGVAVSSSSYVSLLSMSC